MMARPGSTRAAPALKHYRQIAGLGQEELAKRAEMTRGTVARIEGGAQATIPSIGKLAAALGVEPAALLAAVDAPGQERGSRVKYVVTDPVGTEVATYEQKADGSGWDFWEPSGPYLEHGRSSNAPTLIDAVLERHRQQGRVVTRVS